MIHGGGMIGPESDGCRDGLMIDNEIDMKMNIRYHKTTVLGLAFALCLSGCSLLEKFDKSPKYSVKGSASRERNAVDASDSQTPVLAPKKGKKTVICTWEEVLTSHSITVLSLEDVLPPSKS